MGSYEMAQYFNSDGLLFNCPLREGFDLVKVCYFILNINFLCVANYFSLTSKRNSKYNDDSASAPPLPPHAKQ
jgi:hypothetical protein